MKIAWKLFYAHKQSYKIRRKTPEKIHIFVFIVYVVVVANVFHYVKHPANLNLILLVEDGLLSVWLLSSAHRTLHEWTEVRNKKLNSSVLCERMEQILMQLKKKNQFEKKFHSHLFALAYIFFFFRSSQCMIFLLMFHCYN